MSLPNPPILQPLHLLDESSPDFDRQLHDILYEHEYAQCAGHLRHDDLVWLVDYLDKVRPHVRVLPHSPFEPA